MIKRFAVAVMAIGLIAGAGDVYAQCSGTKEKAACCASKKEKAKITELKTVTKDELAQMLQTSNTIVVDARDAESFAAGHINGAINFGKASLPENKDAQLIFYCGGEKCPAAAKAARKALEDGYKNVMVFRGGWAEWNKQS